MSKAINDLKRITNRLKDVVSKDALSQRELKKLGRFATDLIVKRTRLGFGVSGQLGEKKPLKKLAKSYVSQRKLFSGLDSTTTPGKSNLTRTGQMLRSMGYEIDGQSVVIKPFGTRKSGLTNEELAEYNADKGRIFNRVSKLEFNQILRFYRKTFGDLLRLRKLIT